MNATRKQSYYERPVEELLEEARAKRDEWAPYERGALLLLQQLGVHYPGAATSFDNGKPGDKWSAWAADSILWTIDRIRADVPHEAVRGIFQVYEYSGRAGFLPSHISDARSALRNYIEDKLRIVEGK
jgi:hypothetical protein